MISLDGKILVALPNITQGVFSKALIFVQQSDSNGTVGFILNKRFPPNKAKYIASQLNISEWNRVYYGGPVATNTGFVLHSEDYRNDDTVQVLDNICAPDIGIQVTPETLAGRYCECPGAGLSNQIPIPTK